ncbi:hypothetical protein BSKO_12285 [Bryopsis sp. KO-2023]|nr:hypothetical protein BSKO_12285 [Bryopsis sp. KO-2023]
MNGQGVHSLASVEDSETVQCKLHGVEYVLSVSTLKDGVLVVEVEQTADASRWKGEFSSRYVEDITAKTGNFKKYPTFTTMLLSALKGQSDSVFIDVLTYGDLEALKNRRAASHQVSTPLQSKIPRNNKRYLILTYSAEFDRVHYPLPLVYEENPDPVRLKEIIKELRSKLAKAGLHGGREVDGLHDKEWEDLRDENNMLRSQLDEILSQGAVVDKKEAREATREMRLALKERDLIMQRAEAAEADLERERGIRRREARRQNKEVQELQDELNRCREELRQQRLKCREMTRTIDMLQPKRKKKVEPYRNAPKARTGRPVDRRASPARSNGGQSTRSGGSRVASPSTSVMSQSSCDRSSRSRPSSAPSRPRFDPTQYVKQKREKERAAASRQRWSSPGFGSGRDSSPDSRASSARRVRQRPPASPHQQSTPRSRKPLVQKNFSRNRSRERPSEEAEPRYPSRRQRPLSPNQALQDVKRRLTEYKSNSSAKVRSPQAVRSKASNQIPHEELHDARIEENEHPSQNLTEAQWEESNVELADVDSRLQALQSFLRLAKGSTEPGDA